MVPETQVVVKKVAVCVPVCEERTVMQAHVTCKPVTKMVKKCVDQGHWECREVCVKPGICERIREACKKHRQGCCYCPPPVKTKTVKVWVPCKVWVETPVTVMEKVCEMRPVTCKVTVMKQEWREEKCTVTVYKCVAEQKVETYTVMVKKMVPFEATRCVAVCVPVQETVTCTRMVCRKVEKQVACVPCCCEPVKCCKPKKGGLFGH
jgi:hypothetical protein